MILTIRSASSQVGRRNRRLRSLIFLTPSLPMTPSGTTWIPGSRVGNPAAAQIAQERAMKKGGSRFFRCSSMVTPFRRD
jgi:hypothetical protein